MCLLPQGKGVGLAELPWVLGLLFRGVNQGSIRALCDLVPQEPLVARAVATQELRQRREVAEEGEPLLTPPSKATAAAY